MKLLAKGIISWYLNLINPIIKFFIRIEINPNHLTTLGFLIQIVAVYFVATGKFFTGGWLIWAAGTCDIIDGQLARSRGSGTKFGAIYDSTLDRYAEFAIFFGFSFYFIRNDFFLSSIVTFIALGGSLMTSYIRARGESLGIGSKVGIMQRPDRVVYIGGAAILCGIPGLSPYPLVIVLVVIAIMANVTALQRLVHLYKSTDKGRELLTTSERE